MGALELHNEHLFGMIGAMSTTPMELLLPLGDASVPDELTTRRWQHLMTIAGIDAGSAQRLARAFPSLAAVYAAGEEQLVRVVGPVVASRMRWFLDAPLDTGLSLRAVASARAA
jgi:hypothetical protein